VRTEQKTLIGAASAVVPHSSAVGKLTGMRGFLILFVTASIWSCTDDRLVDIKLNDTIPPAAITDIVADSATSGSITLRWTAPGDNGDRGTAAAYDIRYHKSEITSANWDSATQCEGEPTPKPAGSPESFVVTGLEELTQYFFAIKAVDDADNKSTISDVVSDTTLEKYYVTWARTFGGWDWEFVDDVAVAPDGGYVIVGDSWSFGHIYLVKVDTNGSLEWAKTCATSPVSTARTIAVTPDGGYMMAGYIGFTESSDAYFLKVDGSGNLLWEIQYDGMDVTSGRAAVVAHDGGYIAIGDTYAHSPTTPEESLGFSFILKLSESGEILWVDSLTLSVGPYLAPLSITATPDGGYVIAGTGGGYDIPHFDFIMKIDDSGNQVWYRTFRGGLHDYVWSVTVGAEGEVIVAGTWYGEDPVSSDDDDILLLKFGASGNKLWELILGGDFKGNGWSIVSTADGCYVVAGDFAAVANSADVYLAKVDNSGQLLWERRYGGDQADGARSIAVAPDGGLMVGAMTESFGAGASDYWLLKLDPQGRLYE
jgi:hypothetical protein